MIFFLWLLCECVCDGNIVELTYISDFWVSWFEDYLLLGRLGEFLKMIWMVSFEVGKHDGCASPTSSVLFLAYSALHFILFEVYYKYLPNNRF